MTSVSSVRQSVRYPSTTSLRAQPSLRFDVPNTVKGEQPHGTLEALPSVAEFSSTMDRAGPIPNPPVALDLVTGQEVAQVLEYEEVPPWSQPRSIDDLHFVYTNRCETALCRCLRVLLLLVPIGLITLGTMYLHHCPLVPLLPPWAISTGILWIIHCGCYFLFRKSTEKNTKGYRFIKGCFIYTAVIAFIMGTVLTFGSLSRYDMNKKSSNNYCEPRIYFASSFLVTCGYLVLAVFIYFYTFTFHFSSYDVPEIPQ